MADAQCWIDRFEDRFRLLPCCKDEAHFDERYKPFVELALVCYLLTRDGHATAPWSIWASRTANRLFSHLEWEGLIEKFRLCPAGVLGLVVYPFLALATGKSPKFFAEAQLLIEHPYSGAHERTPMRQMDYQFTRFLFSKGCSMPPMGEQIAQTILKAPTDPLLMDTDALYDVTHVIFYATRFGIQPDVFVEAVRNWLREHLGTMALARFLMGDADLGAELLLGRIYLGDPVDEGMLDCIERLVGAALPGGAFSGPAAGEDASCEFRDNYHTTLVALVTLAEFDLIAGMPGD